MNHPSCIRRCLIPAVLFTLALFTGCAPDPGSSTDSVASSTTASHLTPVSFSGSTTRANVTITGLSNQSVYLVKVNNSASTASASQTGYASPSYSALDADIDEATAVDPSASLVSGQFGPITRYDFAAARDFNAKVPAISRSAARDTATTKGTEKFVSETPATMSAGTTTISYYIQKADNSWSLVTATLRGHSTYANVWVVSDSYNAVSPSTTDGKITQVQAQTIADTFKKIYPVETNVIGREFGGADGSGGRDGDTAVNILIYDISEDGTKPLTSGGIVGYFWSKDYFTDTELANAGYPDYRSNKAEIFYIDSYFADAEPGVMYSTLCHEFQHMVNFNNKFVQNNVQSDTWYDEMLSMTVEDMMSSYLSQSDWLGSEYSALSDGPILNRMLYFDNGFYVSGVNDWIYYDSNYTYMFSYASAYAFGAYLARNYGGAPLVAAMEANSFVDTDSVSAALASVGAGETTFSAAFQRYGEALVFSSSAYSDKTVPSSINTFDRTSTTTVNGTSYTFPAFDIWNLPYTYNGTTTVYSPYYYGVNKIFDLRPYGMSLHSAPSWQNVTGSFTISLSKPTDTDVSFYLMVR
jgi:hypothetical protein